MDQEALPEIRRREMSDISGVKVGANCEATGHVGTSKFPNPQPIRALDSRLSAYNDPVLDAIACHHKQIIKIDFCKPVLSLLSIFDSCLATFLVRILTTFPLAIMSSFGFSLRYVLGGRNSPIRSQGAPCEI